MLQKIAALFFIHLLLFTCKTFEQAISQNQIDPKLYSDCESSPYILPYEINSEYTVIQGNNEKRGSVWTHFDQMKYAYDFEMPIGSKIIAARSGMVIFVRDQFTDNEHGKDQGNAIVVLHEDNTAALYGHFTYKGALVKMGQSVQQGETIGLSGNSGESPVPHLHFQVNKNPDFSMSSSIPISFRNVNPKDIILIKGKKYRADNYSGS